MQPPFFFYTIKHRISEGTNVNITTNFLNSSDEIKVREWVAVIYDNSWYQGLVEKVNDKLEINFMNRSVKRFYWSLKPDKQVVPKNEFLCRVANPPFPISARHEHRWWCSKFIFLMVRLLPLKSTSAKQENTK